MKSRLFFLFLGKRMKASAVSLRDSLALDDPAAELEELHVKYAHNYANVVHAL
jgi:hypothetical protein